MNFLTLAIPINYDYTAKEICPCMMCAVSETTANAVVGVRNTNMQGFCIPINYDIMKTNTLSKEAETRLIDFFNHTIDPVDMAKVLRQVNYILALGVMREHETLQNGLINFEDNFYWLNELAEILNPYLSEG